jgi:L,D-transpeptidase catalytic domain
MSLTPARTPHLLRRILGMLLAIVSTFAVGLSVATPAAAVENTPNYDVERALDRLGLPVGKVDGSYTAYSKRALCAWRAATGRDSSRAVPTWREERAIVNTERLPRVRDYMVTGLNINQKCQTMFWVANGKNGRYYKGIFGVSTGTRDHPTRLGTFRIFRQRNSWVESNIYSDAWMWRPKFFSGGMAVHGSRSDAWIMPYPASHGCVRMYTADINRLWREGVGIGTRVKVYNRF